MYYLFLVLRTFLHTHTTKELDLDWQDKKK